MTSNTNLRLPSLQNPGKYPYVRFTQWRDGSWHRIDETPGNESQAQGHKLGSFEETDNSAGHKHLKLGQAFDYAAQGSTETVDKNHHEKIGGGRVSQVGGDQHTEHGGSHFHAIGGDHIQASAGFHYTHSTGGISHSSVGDKVTDHNDGNDHHNIQGDKITFVGGVKYENINSEFGIFVGGNFDVLVKGNSQFTSTDFLVNASQNVITTSPTIFANTTNFIINNVSGNSLLTVGNSQTNTQINSTGIITPSIQIGDPVQFVNTSTLNIGALAVSANGSNGSPGQILTSNGVGTFWAFPTPLAAGTNTQVQFNNSNTTYATAGFTFDLTQNNVFIGNTLIVNSISVNGSIGTNGQVLTSNGTTAYWSTPASLSGFVTNTQLQSNLANYQTLAGLAANVLLLTANNTNFVGSITAANVVSNSQLQSNLANYQTTFGLAGNVAGLVANNVTYVGTTLAINVISATQLQGNLANYQTSAGLASNVAGLTANNTSFVGSTSAANVVSNTQLQSNLANYQTTSGLAANVAGLTANNTNYVGSVTAANVVSNSQLQSNLANYQTTSGLASNVVTLTANSANFIGSTSAANVVSNAQLQSNLAAYQTTAGLAANVAGLTANNTTYVGSVTAANVVSNAQLQSNLANYALLNGAAFTGAISTSGNLSVSGNLSITGDLFIAGNTTFVNATSIVTNDKTIILADASNSSLLANGAGIQVANVTFLYYDNGTASWQTNVALTPLSNNQNLGGPSNLWNLYANQIAGILTTANQPNITANNTNFVGAVSAANVVSNSQLQSNLANYQTTAGLAANVLILTANNTTYVGTVTAANVVSNAQLQANLANYQTAAGLASNVAGLTANNSTNFAGQPQSYYANITNPNFTTSVNVGANVQLTTAKLTIGNTTANSTTIVTSNLVINAISANSSLGVNGQFLASNGSSVYWANGAQSRQQFTGTGTANSFTIVGGYAPNAIDVYVNGVKAYAGVDVAISSGSTINFTNPPPNNARIDVVACVAAIAVSAVASGLNSQIQFNNNGALGADANLTWQNETLILGNATVNTSINSIVYFSGNSTVYTTGNSTTDVWVSSSSNTSINSTAYFSGNSTYYTISNSTTDLWVSPTSNALINATTIFFGNSTVNTIVNSSIYQSGNSTVYTVSNSSTDVWVGATSNASINATIIFVGNSTSNTTINSTAIITGTPTQGNYSNQVITSAYYIQNYYGGLVNKFRNPGFDIPQRGTSGSIATSGVGYYTIDGWMLQATGGVSLAWSQVLNSSLWGNAYRITCASGLSSTVLFQRIESYAAVEMFSKYGAAIPVTIQFTIYNGTSSTITPQIATAYPSARDNFATITTDLSATNLQSIPAGTIVTVAYTYIPSTFMWRGFEVILSFGSQLAGTSGYVDIGYADIRATPGIPTGLNNSPPPPEIRPIGIELPFNQRYFQTSYALGVAPGTNLGAGQNTIYIPYVSTGGCVGTVRYKTSMRPGTVLTLYDYSGNANKYSYYNSGWVNNGSLASINLPLSTEGFSVQGIPTVNTWIAFDYSVSAEL